MAIRFKSESARRLREQSPDIITGNQGLAVAPISPIQPPSAFGNQTAFNKPTLDTYGAALGAASLGNLGDKIKEALQSAKLGLIRCLAANFTDADWTSKVDTWTSLIKTQLGSWESTNVPGLPGQIARCKDGWTPPASTSSTTFIGADISGVIGACSAFFKGMTPPYESCLTAECIADQKRTSGCYLLCKESVAGGAVSDAINILIRAIPNSPTLCTTSATADPSQTITLDYIYANIIPYATSVWEDNVRDTLSSFGKGKNDVKGAMIKAFPLDPKTGAATLTISQVLTKIKSTVNGLSGEVCTGANAKCKITT